MFGNLFEEENTYHLGAQLTTPSPEEAQGGSGSTPIGNAPPQPRTSCRLAGLWNQGATCYLNSLLQTLFLTPEFRENLFLLSEGELGNLSNKSIPGAKVRVIPLQLQRLFTQLLFAELRSVSTAELTESFGWTNNEELQQHDVQELNRILFSAIEDSLVGTSGQNLIHKLYHGQLVNQIICSECGKVSERQEDFVDIPLTVSKESCSLELGLGLLYCEMETMDGNNKYHCDQCQKLVAAKKGARLRSLPPILSFSLLRFSYDFVRMERFKETRKFTFPKLIDMTAFTETALPGCDCEYELFSLVIHRGGTHGGHYHAYIKDIDGLGTWTETTREVMIHPSVTESSPVGKVKENEYKGLFDSHKTESPCVMLTNILAKTENFTLPVDKLCMEFVKYSGASWNKRFKKQHGPITQYLARHPDKFNTESNCVSLLSIPATSSPLEATPSVGPLEASNSTNSMSQSSATSPTDRHCGGWFDIDDSDVSPINEADLEKQYMGKESAYMLFYRKTSLKRPQAAWKNPAYKVPEHLLVEALADNAKLEHERANYDRTMNQITLQIHYSCYYEYREGALHPCSDQWYFVPLVIDKRKTVADLKIAVRELDKNAVLDPHFHIHTLKKLVAGGHLYDHLTADDTKHIEELPIKYGAKLFVWDGKKVRNQDVPVGTESEPILLTVIYGNPLQFTHAYAKSLSMSAFKTLVSQHTGIPINRISIKKLQQTGSQVSVIEMCCSNNNNDSDDSLVQTLIELGLTDGDELVVEDESFSGCSLTEWTIAKRNKLLVTVENLCNQIPNGVYQSVVVETEKDMLVSDVKTIAIAKLRIENIPEETCLSLEKDGSSRRLPLWENAMIHDMIHGADHLLFLEPRPPLKENQMTIFVGFGASLKRSTPDLELRLTKDSTIEYCMTQIVSQWDQILPEDGWHLRKTTWCGEPSNLLNQLSASLEGSQITHGDRMLCEHGKLPQKGFVHISVWLFPALSGQESSVLSWITTTFQSLWNGSDEKAPDEPVLLGNLEVSKLATLEELKIQVMSLPQLAEQNNCQLLRLRLLENQKLTTVLKGHNNTIQNLKLPESSQIAVQVLSSEENLHPEELVLTIKHRLCESRQYKEPAEMIWDTGQGASLDHLKRAVASFLSIPDQNILLAKYLPSKCDWMILQDLPVQSVSKKATARSRRKNQHRILSVQSSPYYIADGDVLGAKDILEENKELNDFCTADDDHKREEFLRDTAENTRHNSRNNKMYVSDVTQNRTKDKSRMMESRKSCPEVGLTIKVDKFT